MKERPILFSAPMVRAILEGRKTQTRRVVTPQPTSNDNFAGGAYIERRPGRTDGGKDRTSVAAPLEFLGPLCPYGQPGDRLWVREAFADLKGTGIEHRPDPCGPMQRYAFAADSPPGSASDEARKDYGVRWKPSIHMPRAACRITLEVTDVRVERLQAISEGEAVAEGASTPGPFAVHHFMSLWNSINGAGAWNANPWVWVMGFRRVAP